MVMGIAVEKSSRAVSARELIQGTATCTAVTVISYARMTGADPIFQFVWRSRIGSVLLFGLLAAAAIATLSMVIAVMRTPKERTFHLVSHVSASAAALVIGYVLLGYFSINPAESLRFVAAPLALPLLVVLAGANALLWRQIRVSKAQISIKWPVEILVGIGAVFFAVALHLATNAAEMESFGIQNFLVLLGVVSPLLCFLTSFTNLRQTKGLASVAGVAATAGTCVMIAILALL